MSASVQWQNGASGQVTAEVAARGSQGSHFQSDDRILNVLEEFCEFRNFNHERLDGSITGNKRQEAIDRFNMTDDSFVFLLSTRAGEGYQSHGSGHLHIFDSDWNLK